MKPKESRAPSQRNAIKAKSNLGDKCENVSNARTEKGAWLQLTGSSLPASRQSIKRNNICALKTVDKMATTVGAAIWKYCKCKKLRRRRVNRCFSPVLCLFVFVFEFDAACGTVCISPQKCCQLSAEFGPNFSGRANAHFWRISTHTFSVSATPQLVTSLKNAISPSFHIYIHTLENRLEFP